jgi:hypothetical protein
MDAILDKAVPKSNSRGAPLMDAQKSPGHWISEWMAKVKKFGFDSILTEFLRCATLAKGTKGKTSDQKISPNTVGQSSLLGLHTAPEKRT